MKIFLRKILVSIFLLPSIVSAKSLDATQVDQFIDSMVEKYDFNEVRLSKLFRNTTYSDKVLQAISRPAEKSLPWYKYKKIFLRDKRIKEGVKFWEKHEQTLLKAEKIYGVPPQIIVAIIGIETQYGKNTGKNKVMDSLATLAFHFPRRSNFFRSELEQFLLLSREQQFDPLSLKGSYAGAMGIPQFIASSYRNYAVDFDNDKKTDILINPVDSIGSVANYFKRHNWQTGQPVAVKLKASDSRLHELMDSDLNPNISLSELQQYSIVVEHDLPDNTLLKVLKFDQQYTDEYWLGTYNFYVITRYNHSELYAMAVYQLSELIKNLYHN